MVRAAWNSNTCLLLVIALVWHICSLLMNVPVWATGPHLAAAPLKLRLPLFFVLAALQHDGLLHLQVRLSGTMRLHAQPLLL